MSFDERPLHEYLLGGLLLSYCLIGMIVVWRDVGKTGKGRLIVRPQSPGDWADALFLYPLFWPLICLNAAMRKSDESDVQDELQKKK